MDLSNPLAVVTPTLDAAVLLALTATTAWATGAHVHRMAGTGSPDGVRRVLARLVAQGVVLAEEHGHATLYLLNRDHAAAHAIVELARLRGTIVGLVSSEIAGWDIKPLHASLFGSFARGEAGLGSDIDLLVVADPEVEQSAVWTSQIDSLATQIERWTGNPADILSPTVAALIEMLRSDDPLIASWRAECVHLHGEQILEFLRSVRQRGTGVAGASGVELTGTR